MKRTATYVLFILSLSACGTMSDPMLGDLSVDGQGEGIVVLSLTLTGKALSKVDSFEYWVRPVAQSDGEPVRERRYFVSTKRFGQWVANGTGEHESIRKVTVKGADSIEPLNVVDGSESVGRVVTLRLPAGDYEFYSWAVRDVNFHGGIEVTPQYVTSYRFTVQPNKYSYAGQLNLALSGHKTVQTTVEDQKTRDLALLKKKYRWFVVDQVQTDLLKIQR